MKNLLQIQALLKKYGKSALYKKITNAENKLSLFTCFKSSGISKEDQNTIANLMKFA